ncbi:MAG: hypothetical protein ACFFD4_15675 [Candidatus Odinarchaeota archaeon]
MVMVSYEHYGILVFAQGTWREKDKESLLRKIGQRNIHNLYRSSLPTNCYLCNQIYDIFEEIRGMNDGIIYVAHAFLEPDAMKEFTDIVLGDERVKKFFLFQGGLVKDKKGNPVVRKKGSPPIMRRRYHKVDLKERLMLKKCTKSEFIEILEEKEFQYEILYEVTKEKYY